MNQQQPNWQQDSTDKNPAALGPVAQQLATRITQHINAAAAINPVNLVASALLSTQRLALDENALVRVINLYVSLLRSVPYSAYTSLPEGDGVSITQYVRDMQLISEQKRRARTHLLFR